MEHFVRIRIGVFLVLGIGVVLVWLPVLGVQSARSSYLQVRFLDVGQGDAIHIVTPDGYEALIDGGLTTQVLRELASGQSLLDRSIDVVIATHPDADHIGGLVDVLERYQVDWIIQTDNQHETPVTAAFANQLKTEGAQVVTAQAGQVLQLGASTTLRFFSPTGDSTNWPSNAASIIMQISYGDIDFLLTGDAPSSIEDYIVGAYGAALQSEVLKLGHHGSKTSTSELFLNTVQPDFAVVSAGKDNRYGHPHQEVVERVSDKGVEIVSTAEVGTVIFMTNGDKIWQK